MTKSDVMALPCDDEQDARILRLRVDGLSNREVAQELGLQEHEIKQSLKRSLPRIDGLFKAQQHALLVLRMERLCKAVQPKALQGDPEAQSAMIRISQEQRALLGFYGSGFDPIAVTPTGGPGENSMSGFYRGLQKLGRWSDAPPAIEAPGSAPVLDAESAPCPGSSSSD